jgi:thiamine pyrophosphokinase
MIPQALILANGEPPTKHLLKLLLKNAALFVCADGGVNTAARYGLKPNGVVGDMDSARPASLRKCPSTAIHKIVDDNSTDLEKSISWVLQEGFQHIVVLGATGGRLDHFIGNLSALVKMSMHATVQFIDDSGEWIFVGRFKNLSLPVGVTVSLIPLSRCDGIVTKGLKWNLNFESLELGVRDGTSNLVVESPVHISVAKGNLVLYHQFPKKRPIPKQRVRRTRGR